MATKAEVRQRIGEDLGLVPVAQALESQDDTRIDTAFAEAYARLKEKGLASWAYSGDVPTKIVPDFCLLVEESLVTSYSIPESRALRIKTAAGQGGVEAIKRISELSIQEYDSTDGPQDF